MGSIGVTSSYVDNVEKNQKDGLTFNQLSAGKLKDGGNPDKTLTLEERANIMELVNNNYEILVQSIADNRHMDKEKLLPLADGRMLTSTQALEAGLIDKIGTKYDALEFIKQQVGQEPSLCE